MDDFPHIDDHALLGIPPGAPRDEIKQAYRRELRKFHSDRYHNADSRMQQYAGERSQPLTKANAALSPTSRQRTSPVTRSPAGGAPASPSRGEFSQPRAGAPSASSGANELRPPVLAEGYDVRVCRFCQWERRGPI